jgi:flagellar protein FliJ
MASGSRDEDADASKVHRRVDLRAGLPSRPRGFGEYESMKSRETLIRLKKFQVDEKRRKVVQIEGMIAEFDRMALDLDREIHAEQERAGIHDPAHFAYPTYAKAAIGRRDNLKRSADELKGQLEDARANLAEAFEEMKKIELLDERDQVRERGLENAREQAELDRIATTRARDGIGV